jgi:hypothetical protein
LSNPIKPTAINIDIGRKVISNDSIGPNIIPFSAAAAATHSPSNLKQRGTISINDDSAQATHKAREAMARVAVAVVVVVVTVDARSIIRLK